MATSSSLLSCYILLNLFFFLLLIEKSFQVSVRALAGEHHVIDVKSLLPSNSCTIPNKSTSSSRLNVVHRQGLCSSWALQDKSSHMELLRRDQAHVDYIHHQAANANGRLNLVGSSLFARVPARNGYHFGNNYYIVQIGLGTPPKHFKVIFDTGSDLTWIQCVPCINCYTQKDHIFDPTQSSSSSDISCTSTYCTQLTQFACSSTDTCLYHQNYFDSSHTNGSLLQDTLKLSFDTIHNFRHGCGHDNSGSFGQVAGILGLGRGALSIISQAGQLYNNVFSYCLPSGPNHVGYLELGSSVPGVNYTPMLTNPNLPSYYFLNFIAISIGDTRINFPPIATMMDSGTIISRLPPSIYSNLRSIFQNKMINYPMAPPYLILDTCYDLTNYPTVVVPNMELIFDGEVTASLNQRGILYVVSISQVCLAFAGVNDLNDITIFGNMQQRTLNVVYDVRNLKIGFGGNGCN